MQGKNKLVMLFNINKLGSHPLLTNYIFFLVSSQDAALFRRCVT